MVPITVQARLAHYLANRATHGFVPSNGYAFKLRNSHGRCNPGAYGGATRAGRPHTALPGWAISDRSDGRSSGPVPVSFKCLLGGAAIGRRAGSPPLAPRCGAALYPTAWPFGRAASDTCDSQSKVTNGHHLSRDWGGRASFTCPNGGPVRLTVTHLSCGSRTVGAILARTIGQPSPVGRTPLYLVGQSQTI